MIWYQLVITYYWVMKTFQSRSSKSYNEIKWWKIYNIQKNTDYLRNQRMYSQTQERLSSVESKNSDSIPRSNDWRKNTDRHKIILTFGHAMTGPVTFVFILNIILMSAMSSRTAPCPASPLSGSPPPLRSVQNVKPTNQGLFSTA